MIQTKVYHHDNMPSAETREQVVSFLHEHLEQYGDQKQDIAKAYDFAIGINGNSGGMIILAYKEEYLAGATIINKTGMEGYIPENILVYIATHKQHRGNGIASKLMEAAIKTSEGNIALHVEPDNPALKLYQKFGFTNKYLEMRLNKKEVANGVRNA